MNPAPNRVDDLLASLSDNQKYSELIGLFYGELHRMADTYFQNERRDHTLQPTALVHELFLNWSTHRPKDGLSRAEFFAAASRAMRRFLIDYARSHTAIKRGGDRQKLALEDVDLPGPESPDYDAIDRVLRMLESHDARAAHIVELRVFGGLSSTQIAELLGMAEGTVRQEWTFAKRWIEERLKLGLV